MDIALKQYRKRLVAGLIGFGIFALGIIPVFTIIMGTLANPFKESMSFMGNLPGNRFWFLLWTFTFCGFFGSFVGYILRLTRNTHSRVRILVYIAVGTLIFGNIVPFLPEDLPGFAELHNFCAQISSISLAIVIVLLAATFRKLYPALFKKSITFAFIIWGVLLGCIALFSIVSITEMISIILGGIFLFVVLIWLYKQENFDPVESLQYLDAHDAAEEVEKLRKKTEEAKAEYEKLTKKLSMAIAEADKLAKVAKQKKFAEKYAEMRNKK